MAIKTNIRVKKGEENSKKEGVESLFFLNKG